MRVYDAIGLRDSPVLPQLLRGLQTWYIDVYFCYDLSPCRFVERSCAVFLPCIVQEFCYRSRVKTNKIGDKVVLKGKLHRNLKVWERFYLSIPIALFESKSEIVSQYQ